jgi:hypothetical protein
VSCECLIPGPGHCPAECSLQSLVQTH